MKTYKITPLEKIDAMVAVPADKSISHRALLTGALCEGRTVAENFLHSSDTRATLACIKKLLPGVEYDRKKNRVTLRGCARFPGTGKIRFHAGESGTTIRLLSGILTGQKFASLIDAAPALRARPMRRIIEPLRLMGADIRGRYSGGEDHPPLTINPVDCLSGITYTMPVASAQVKSALLYASLFSRTSVRIKEPFPSRDHTERMLRSFGVRVRKQKGFLVCGPARLKTPGRIHIPGDFSSAAFFIVLGLLLPESRVRLTDVGINPTRTGLLTVLKRMGARITFENIRRGVEPRADIIVRSSALRATTVSAGEIPLMIDEVPVLMSAAAYARGTTRIYGLNELKVKETDRLRSMMTNLKKAGVDVHEASGTAKKSCSVSIRGGGKIKTAAFRSFNDHRTAMSMIIFATASGREHTIDDIKCIDKSFPEFVDITGRLK